MTIGVPGRLRAYLAGTGSTPGSVHATGPEAVEGWVEPPQFRAQKNDVGSSALAVKRTHAVAPKMRDYVHRIQVNHVTTDGDGIESERPLFCSRWIETPDDTLICQGDSAAKILRVTARGLVAEFDDVVVEPEYGWGWKPFYPTRFFDWRSRGLDRSAWTPSVTNPFESDITAGVTGLYGRHWPPNGWVAPYAGWVWSRASTGQQMPIGKSYGARAFTTADELISYLQGACDDRIKFSLDGCPWLNGDDEQSWEFAYRRKGTISGGNHLLTWEADNADRKWPSNTYNIAALAYAMFALTDAESGAVTYDNLIIESGYMPNPTPPYTPALTDGAVWLDYPSTPPGFTPGSVMLTLISEWQATGHLPDLVVTFTDTHDSAGNPWDVTTQYAFQCGMTGLRVLLQLAQDDIDFTINPGLPPTLNMFVKGYLATSAGFAMQGAEPITAPDDVNLMGLRIVGQG